MAVGILCGVVAAPLNDYWQSSPWITYGAFIIGAILLITGIVCYQPQPSRQGGNNE